MNIRRPLRDLVCFALLSFASAAFPQEGVLEAQEHLRLANAAYENRDYPAQAAHLETALALNPASLRTRYNLACAYALMGDLTQSMAMLGQLADLGVDYGIAEDPDLASLRTQPAFQSLVARLNQNVEPVTTSRLLVTVAEFGLVPEGVAHDAATGRIFFGSMRNGDIYVLDEARRLSRFATIDVPGFSAIGLTVDKARGTLWAVGTATEFAATTSREPQTRTSIERPTDKTGTPIEDKTGTPTENSAADNSSGKTGTSTENSAANNSSVETPALPRGGQPDAPAARTGLFGFELATGTASARFLADPAIEGFNDVAIAPNGDIYLSGSHLSVVSPDHGDVRPLSTSPRLIGTNGIAVSPDGTKLFTSVYPVGIASVDLTTGQTHFLELPDNATLYGIDGLYLHEGDLLAVQNGTTPWRLIRIGLDQEERSVTGIRVLERANASVTATTGAIAGDQIIYIGQGPAPDPPPIHVPDTLVPFFGQTLIMAAPLD